MDANVDSEEFGAHSWWNKKLNRLEKWEIITAFNRLYKNGKVVKGAEFMIGANFKTVISYLQDEESKMSASRFGPGYKET